MRVYSVYLLHIEYIYLYIYIVSIHLNMYIIIFYIIHKYI